MRGMEEWIVSKGEREVGGGEKERERERERER